jgi:hypothetical protein
MNEPFREELERWARRPPERPAPVARGRVLAQIESRPGLLWKLPVAAVLLAGLALVLVLGLRGNPVQPVPPETPSQSLVVVQLQSGTKVYFVMKGDPL